ncbi:hypothetical protein BVC93_01655 [Mycobacterium sp. MS1601]|uniref:DoxX family protein n=1 Tax=Mycobacterium sp. MS1601 TaxID=1936029 RepID=UPI0009797F54|nr:DoxX family protein [Mycobacterium sp. MS1601]AQA01349.1 hypothetical protein BVC93_01655 [Mycobacterium sp. MS1601]
MTTSTLDSRLGTYAPTALGVFRIVFGVLFLCHATAHLVGWPGGQAAAFGQWPYFYAGVIELITGVLITVGLFTRIAAFIASGNMAVAFFLQHAPQGLVPMTNGGEAAVLYCFAFLFLVFSGAGALSFDNRRS